MQHALGSGATTAKATFRIALAAAGRQPRPPVLPRACRPRSTRGPLPDGVQVHDGLLYFKKAMTREGPDGTDSMPSRRGYVFPGLCRNKYKSIDSRAQGQRKAATGVKPADAIHTVCAILANCDHLLTMNDRLLKYKPERIEIIDPIELIKRIGGENDD